MGPSMNRIGRSDVVGALLVDLSKPFDTALTDKSHEIHMWILCVVPISHVHFTCERNVNELT